MSCIYGVALLACVQFPRLVRMLFLNLECFAFSVQGLVVLDAVGLFGQNQTVGPGSSSLDE